jgi:hypothetical protein
MSLYGVGPLELLFIIALGLIGPRDIGEAALQAPDEVYYREDSKPGILFSFVEDIPKMLGACGELAHSSNVQGVHPVLIVLQFLRGSL